MEKFIHLIPKEGDNYKCYVKFVFWKVFQNPIKLLTSPYLYSQSTQREIRDSSGTRRALGHSGTRRREIGHFKGTSRALKGHLVTRALNAFGYLGTWTIKHLRHSGTQRALRHSRHLATWALRHSKGFWALKHLRIWLLRHSRHFI